MTSKVSVIVPIYNKEFYLKRCISSIVHQSYHNLQIILVDDGSTDSSRDICRYYQTQDFRIEVIEQENLGVSIARNRGIEQAKGEYVIFVDADDYIDSDYIMQLVNVQKKYPDYLIVCSVNDNKQLPFPSYDKEKNKWEIKDDLAEVLANGFISSIWNKLFRLNLIKKHNIKFNEKINFGEDGLFCLDYIALNNLQEIYLQKSVSYHYEIKVKHSLSMGYHRNMYKMVCMLNSKIAKMTLQYHILDNSEVYYQLLKNIESALLDYFCGSRDGLLVKIKKCNRVLRSDRYRFYSKKAQPAMSDIRKYICKSGNIFYLFLFLKLCDIRNFMIKERTFL